MAETESAPRNREAWLTDAIALMRPIIKQRTGLAPLKSIKVSVGFPPSGGRTRSNTGQPGKVGVCMMSQNHKHTHIFIHPLFDNSTVLADKGVLEILAHETLHASLPEHVGHRKDFSQAAKALGLTGKPRATLLTDELREVLKTAVVDVLGPYPHDEGIAAGGKVQGTRLILCECPLCGYKVRTTRVWIDSAGEPICPQDLITMVEGGAGDEVDNPLVPRDRFVEFAVKATAEQRKIGLRLDPRWCIRMNSTDSGLDWWIVDYGEPFKIVNGVQMAVLDSPKPRLTHAESREDAIVLMEALRSGLTTYNDIAFNDDDPALDDDPDSEYEDDDETEDFPDDSDPRFQWEIDRGIEFDSEVEASRREA